jgi:hypothetical protein
MSTDNIYSYKRYYFVLAGTKTYNNPWEHQVGLSFCKIAYLMYYAPSRLFLKDSTCLKPYKGQQKLMWAHVITLLSDCSESVSV